MKLLYFICYSAFAAQIQNNFESRNAVNSFLAKNRRRRGLLGSLASGVAMGAGATIGHKAINSVWGDSRYAEQESCEDAWAIYEEVREEPEEEREGPFNCCGWMKPALRPEEMEPRIGEPTCGDEDD